jgi:hypothetical protein
MKLIIPEVPFTDWNDKLKIHREIIIKKPKKNTFMCGILYKIQ